MSISDRHSSPTGDLPTYRRASFTPPPPVFKADTTTLEYANSGNYEDFDDSPTSSECDLSLRAFPLRAITITPTRDKVTACARLPGLFRADSTSTHFNMSAKEAASTSEQSASMRHSEQISRSQSTGFRANASLIPLNAPIRNRFYHGPSTTSRKDLSLKVESFISSRNGLKRTRSSAGLDEEAEDSRRPRSCSTPSSPGGGEFVEPDQLESPETVEGHKAMLLAKLEEKRRRNAMSARKSRRMKQVTMERLQADVKRLTDSLHICEKQRDFWKETAGRLGAHQDECPY